MKLPDSLIDQSRKYQRPERHGPFDSFDIIDAFQAGALAALEHAQKRIEKLEGAAWLHIKDCECNTARLEMALEGDDT